MKVEHLTINQRPYADTIRTYLVYIEEEDNVKTEEEVRKLVKKRFGVGDAWHENKLELCRPNHDGSAYTVKIRQPYLD